MTRNWIDYPRVLCPSLQFSRRRHGVIVPAFSLHWLNRGLRSMVYRILCGETPGDDPPLPGDERKESLRKYFVNWPESSTLICKAISKWSATKVNLVLAYYYLSMRRREDRRKSGF